MALPLSTPGKCCGHNLNMHSGDGLEGACLVCSCVGFEPDAEEKMAIKADELRQCQARHGQRMTLQCQGEVTEATVHIGDHWAYEPDGSGNKIFWSELIAMYPAIGPANPDRTQVGTGPARLSQVGGDHYRKRKIQPWDIADEYDLNYFEGAILKYVLRHRDKNGVEDLKKARHTLDKLIEIEERRG